MKTRTYTSTPNRQLFHAGHYNIIAAEICTALSDFMPPTEPHFPSAKSSDYHKAKALIDLALSLSERFAYDNENFDPDRFLTACSPNPVWYPLHTLKDK